MPGGVRFYWFELPDAIDIANRMWEWPMGADATRRFFSRRAVKVDFTDGALWRVNYQVFWDVLFRYGLGKIRCQACGSLGAAAEDERHKNPGNPLRYSLGSPEWLEITTNPMLPICRHCFSMYEKDKDVFTARLLETEAKRIAKGKAPTHRYRGHRPTIRVVELDWNKE